MGARILKAARDLGRENVSGNPDDEELSQNRVEDEFWRHTRVRAAENGREGPLAFRQPFQLIRQYVFETRAAGPETLVSLDEKLLGSFCGDSAGHGCLA